LILYLSKLAVKLSSILFATHNLRMTECGNEGQSCDDIAQKGGKEIA
jgi:hypothetical protein